MESQGSIAPQFVVEKLLNSQVPVAVFSWRNQPGWPLEYVSPNVSKVLGFEAIEFIERGLDYASIIHELDLSRVMQEVMDNSVPGISAFEHEDYRIIDPDGAVRWVKDHTAIHRDEHGEITHYFGYILDITSRVKAESASSEKSRFLAAISHELRTPLNAIIGYAEILEEDLTDQAPLDPAQLCEDSKRINTAGRHLLSLVDSLLDLTRIESGHLELTPTTFLLEPFCEEVIGAVAFLTEKNRNTLRFTSNAIGQSITTDRTKARQILMNLLSNALKFTHDGEVTLNVVIQDDSARFEVHDTGIGISKSDHERIFEPFVQADQASTRRYGGAGLGLNISSRFAARMGGQIKLESEPGRGSCFSLTLPLGFFS